MFWFIMQPTSIVSYNHLGNNDGMNLSAPQTFRSKEISKSNVVDDMVASNSILYAPGEHPDHVIVIKVQISNTLLAYSNSTWNTTSANHGTDVIAQTQILVHRLFQEPKSVVHTNQAFL